MKPTARLRDRSIAAGVVIFVLYLIAAVMWFGNFSGSWRQSRTKLDKIKKEIRMKRALIAKRGEIEALYEKEKASIPTINPLHIKVETHWLAMIERLAESNHVKLVTVQVESRGGEIEQKNGDVFEMTVSVRKWESSLEGLVKFLYDVRKAPGAMFDVRQISITPSSRTPGLLSGSFKLVCAYMKNEDDDVEEDETSKENVSSPESGKPAGRKSSGKGTGNDT